MRAEIWPYRPTYGHSSRLGRNMAIQGPMYRHVAIRPKWDIWATLSLRQGHLLRRAKRSFANFRARACVCVCICDSLTQKFRCVSSTAPLRESMAASPGDERLKHRADDVQQRLQPVEAAPRLPALPSHPSYLRSRGSSSRSEPFQGSSRALRGPFAASCRRFRPPFRQLFPHPGSPLRKVFREPQVTVLKRFLALFLRSTALFTPLSGKNVDNNGAIWGLLGGFPIPSPPPCAAAPRRCCSHCTCSSARSASPCPCRRRPGAWSCHTPRTSARRPEAPGVPCAAPA